MSQLIPVYYYVDTKLNEFDYEQGDPGNPLGILTTTSKDYFDQFNYLDGGDGPHYRGISDALEQCACYELMESVFEMTIDEATMVAQMQAKGYDFISNPAFTQLMIDSQDECEDEIS